MNCAHVDANWWVCGHRTDDSDRLVEAVGLEGLKLKNLRTSDAKAILAKAAKGEIPHKKRAGNNESIRSSCPVLPEICCGSQDIHQTSYSTHREK